MQFFVSLFPRINFAHTHVIKLQKRVSAHFDAESASGTATLPPNAQSKAAHMAQEAQEA